ncbi:MAG: Eco57I restriction-modification methylase domain-containing protein [Candidatus Electrothrix scaldis]|nr:MAG: Eco57I restriction-modification methylase domain-containing protein [Candidatus Electrothrix sp. GW3-3]
MSSLVQTTLFELTHSGVPPVTQEAQKALEELAQTNNREVRGAVYTRAEVANFILDLIGFTEDQPLFKKRILEPSFGNGDFLLPLLDRLLASWKDHSTSHDYKELQHSLIAIELHRQSFITTKETVITKLTSHGISHNRAAKLANTWLLQGDFLLTPLDQQVNFVIGNPPYVRQELIPSPLLREYRSRFQTMYDRADLYVPFFEKALSLLEDSGVLGFICADRWMKNKYGGPLRKKISGNYHLKIYIDMVGTNAFLSDVSTYPAITIINKQRNGPTRILRKPKIEKNSLSTLAAELLAPALPKDSVIQELHNVLHNDAPWLLDPTDKMLSLLRRLELSFPTIEETGCKIGIGVATGADKIFIGKYDTLDVEKNRKLPLARTKDIKTGQVIWQGDGIINPFDSTGTLVNLNTYPKLKKYLYQHKTTIANRHCAKKSPANWYRTIDRINPSLTYRPKLLIPDIKGGAHIVFEPGKLYPHHNLYYIISDKWELQALQAVLLSDITKLFITTYSTKMRGGYFRFQAQYLRRIRIPQWNTVSPSIREELIIASSSRDLTACNRAAFKLYGLSEEDKITLNESRE